MSPDEPAGPPASVLAAFRADPARLLRLPGGQGTTWQAGAVILKPTVDPVEDSWICEAVESLRPRGYRVPQPLRTTGGQWTTDGWCGWSAVAARHGSGERWPEILAVARALHRDLADLPRPLHLDRRHDPWAVGDAVAWGRVYEPAHPAIGVLLEQCAHMRQPEGLVEQVIHGDLFGNVLFADGEAPAVIDLSPYWRPAAYAYAIAAVDALAWYAANPGILADLGDVPALRSLLARAAMFRLVTGDVLATTARLRHEPAYVEDTVRDFARVVELLTLL